LILFALLIFLNAFIHPSQVALTVVADFFSTHAGFYGALISLPLIGLSAVSSFYPSFSSIDLSSSSEVCFSSFLGDCFSVSLLLWLTVSSVTLDSDADADAAELSLVAGSLYSKLASDWVSLASV
jgi:hypothetical protein